MSVWAWLKSKLTNTWMNNMDYGWFMAHSGWALSIFLTTALVSHESRAVLGWLSLGGVAAAALKEYVYDANFEIPKQTFADNTKDFLGYCAGITMGWAIALLHTGLP
jgi:hypothetical protein